MRMALVILWKLGLECDFSVRNNLFGQLSDIAEEQSCFYSEAIP